MTIVGYHTSATPPDPKAVNKYGYRSKSLRRPISLANIDQELYYNGFHFPPGSKVTASAIEEYDKTNRSIKYINIIITVEAIITQFDQAAPVTQSSLLNSGATTDKHVTEIRTRLAQPGQSLRFLMHGFGHIVVNDTDPTYANVATWDVDYGPKTQVIEWEPIGGSLCCRIQWLVSTRIPPCPTINVKDVAFHGITELSYGTSLSIDSSGSPTQTVSGSFSIMGIHSPDPDALTSAVLLDRTGTVARVANAIAYLRNSFSASGFATQTVQYELSPDWRTVSFIFTYEYPATPNVYFPMTSKCDVTESLSSSRELAFRTWKWNVRGNFEVFRGKYLDDETGLNGTINENKAEAFRMFGYLLQNKLSNLLDHVSETVSVPETVEKDGSGSAVQSNSGVSYSTRKTPFFVLESFNLEDDLFSNSFAVEASYTLYDIPGSLLLASMGVFEKLDLTGSDIPNTIENRKNLIVSQKVFDIDASNLVPHLAVINLCVPLIHGSLSETVYEDSPGNESLGSSATPNAEKSWLHYQNNFSYKTSYNTTLAVPLRSLPTPSPDSFIAKYGTGTPNDEEVRTKVEPIIHYDGDVISPSGDVPAIENPTQAITYVTMTGQAIRIGFDIPVPQLLSVSGLTAYPYGEDVISRSIKPLGDYRNVGTGKVANVYHCRWERTYVIYGKPKEAVPKTDGYQHAR